MTVECMNSFSEVLNDFKTEYDEPCPTDLGKNNMGQFCFLEEDVDYQRAWELYHRMNGAYRLLCQKCVISWTKNENDKKASDTSPVDESEDLQVLEEQCKI